MAAWCRKEQDIINHDIVLEHTEYSYLNINRVNVITISAGCRVRTPCQEYINGLLTAFADNWMYNNTILDSAALIPAAQ